MSTIYPHTQSLHLHTYMHAYTQYSVEYGPVLKWWLVVDLSRAFDGASGCLNDTSEPPVAVVVYGTRLVLLEPHMLLPHPSAKAIYKRVYLTNRPTVKWDIALAVRRDIALAVRPDQHYHTPPLTLNASRSKQGVRLNLFGQKRARPKSTAIDLEVAFSNPMSPPQTTTNLPRLEPTPSSKASTLHPPSSPSALSTSASANLMGWSSDGSRPSSEKGTTIPSKAMQVLSAAGKFDSNSTAFG